MSGFRSLNNSTSKRVLNLLEPVKLTVWKVMIEIVTVVKFRVNYGGGNGTGCFEVKVWADTAKFTDVIVARLRKCSDLIREGKVFIENKTKVASGVACSKRADKKTSATADSLRRRVFGGGSMETEQRAVRWGTVSKFSKGRSGFIQVSVRQKRPGE